MIEVECEICSKDMDEPGGLLFSPPMGCDDTYMVNKYHLCQKHYSELMSWVYKRRCEELKDENITE